MNDIKILSRYSPAKTLLTGFVVLMFLGSVLLMLPISTTRGISFTDALFTATSAVCVTGLIVKDTPNDFTLFGQLVILVLIQIGGLGYMALATMVALLLGKKIGIMGRMLIRESLNISTLEGIIKFMRRMLTVVFIVEAMGAAALTFRFYTDMALTDAVYKGIFHSISAFNNAGFSLFSDNLIRYRGDVIINLSIIALIVTGGIGFMVITDVYSNGIRESKRLSQHTKVSITTTAALIASGAILIAFIERNYYFSNFSGKEIILSSLFSSVTPRTAGYNTLDYSLLHPATLFLTIVFMVIGASPGSTGGGIKTTTFAIIIMRIWNTVRGRMDTVIFKRRVPESMVADSLVILALVVIYLSVVTFAITNIERSKFEHTLFEVASAFGTVGLSVGDGGVKSLSATFSPASKYIIIFTMLLGRIGPLSLFAALLGRKEKRFRYPEGRIMIG